MKNIKKMVLVSAFAGTCLTPHAQTASPVIPTDPAIETHIREWLPPTSPFSVLPLKEHSTVNLLYIYR